MLYQLMYSSRMRAELSASDLERLLVKARDNNAKRQVTGVLLVVDDVFVQILEGDKPVVIALARFIAGDARHDDLTVILEQPVDARTFTSWSMAHRTASAQDVARWAALEGGTRIDAVLCELKTRPTQLPTLALNIVAAMGEA
jgi:hypothetical protein